MGTTSTDDFLRLKRIASLREVAELTGVSVDTLKRNYPNQLVRLSPRRVGMRIEDALQIGKAARSGRGRKAETAA